MRRILRKKSIFLWFLLIFGMGLAAVFWCGEFIFDIEFGQILDISPKIAESPHRMVRLCLKDGTVCDMDLEEAVVGYVAAEMSALAPTEALRAQAVAVRSYAWAEQQAAGEICADSGHCMAYLSYEERCARWQDKAEEYEEKLRRAVADTSGEMLYFDGTVAKTYFHAACGGRTALVSSIWGGEDKWESADCYWEGAEVSTLAAVFFSKAELAQKLGVTEDKLALLEVAEESDGRVCRVRLGRKFWHGADFRTLLGLKSTRITWLGGSEGYWFVTLGYGHGVGLCQTGAMGMAEGGYDYRRILAQYYPGLVLS